MQWLRVERGMCGRCIGAAYGPPLVIAGVINSIAGAQGNEGIRPPALFIFREQYC